ncbi:multicopper oxidase domain-containing protein [Methylomarinum vadi]|uniref:multicopper oxidase domain-containing protein n=1 Tax=Methylomarinum vadi TaxID=438855 RepID=UPI00068F0AFF|nr:multicopper oxidase domain-containing protein [Methylomarinum vadi]
MKINYNCFSEFTGVAVCSVLALWTSLCLATPPEVDHVAKNPTEVPAPINRKSPTHLTFDLHPKEVLTDIDGSGAYAWVWTFNGTVPGPMLRVMEGDSVTINIINDANNVEPHNIDLHAALAPGGGAVFTEAEPGETKSFTFVATRQGTYIYHCAAEGQAWEHIAYGMFGLIVVEPRGGLPPVDKEFYIGQSEWYLNHVPNDKTNAHGLPTNTLMLDEQQALTERPNFFSFNGHKNALTNANIHGDAMHAQIGDTVRFFFVNGGPNIGSNWHIIGTIFDKTYQGHFSNPLVNQETEYVAPGSAAMFELEAKEPGTYLLLDHAIFRASNGALGYLQFD